VNSFLTDFISALIMEEKNKKSAKMDVFVEIVKP